ncbi:MAG: hypothetical protein FRX49_02700 [Trebouxia sp. A1-2]|nr:MAG: hypothetical protein FRX49_02700 [Trebouxia sp. A1-2]
MAMLCVAYSLREGPGGWGRGPGIGAAGLTGTYGASTVAYKLQPDWVMVQINGFAEHSDGSPVVPKTLLHLCKYPHGMYAWAPGTWDCTHANYIQEMVAEAGGPWEALGDNYITKWVLRQQIPPNARVPAK